MSIETRTVLRYYAVCDDCGRRYASQPRETMAEADLRDHKCGEHRQEHDSTGGWRGVLGGWNVHCVCGARWVTEDPSEPFKCPNDTQTPAGATPDLPTTRREL